VLPYVDTMLHDHKLTDPERHKKWVGVDNVRIKEKQEGYETSPDKTFIARTPIIPSVNDNEEHIRAVLAFIRPYKCDRLPASAYHRYGESKYGFLGRRSYA
jgi:pyruvate-formate lyase-activating enzyme